VSLPSFGTDPATVNAANLDGKVDPLATEFNGNIENANIKAGAAIAYAKLNLTGGILNADVNASAEIVDTKLATITTAGKVNSSALVTTDQAAGDVLYNDGTNWVRLAKDEGKYLKSAAAAVEWDSPVVAAVDGMVVQMVSTVNNTYSNTTTAIPQDNSIPQSNEGAEVLSRTITPKATTNILLIQVSLCVGGVNGGDISAAIFKDAGANAICAAKTNAVNTEDMVHLTFNHIVVAGAIDEATYKVRFGPGASDTAYLNGNNASRIFGGVAISSITITEIKAS
jgi:hypothetical protein